MIKNTTSTAHNCELTEVEFDKGIMFSAQETGVKYSAQTRISTNYTQDISDTIALNL